MPDHGHTAVSRYILLRIHTHSASQSTGLSDVHSLSPITVSHIERLYAGLDIVSSKHDTTSPPGHKALGTKTLSSRSRHHRSSKAPLSFDSSTIPSRTSSLAGGSLKHISASGKNITKRLRHRNPQQFSSIDGMLASHNDSEVVPRSGRHSTSSNTTPQKVPQTSSRHLAYEPRPYSPSRHNSEASVQRPPIDTIQPLSTVPLLLDPPTHTISATPPQRPSLHLPTTLSWTSDATRRLEYAKIDRAYTGLRGFCRRVLPKSCFGDSRRNFWNGADGHEEDEDDDADSVRRYRLALPETPRSPKEVNEKALMKVRAHSRDKRPVRDRSFSCF
jgi:hypothetical protein